ncbi:5-(carboxyamino)imidazole ribonucleotide synthase [Aeoliella mucimassa]|uniref:N5-carboxyaminoimidazole ribonucleotide synthase n=1 Tax=Aeoliella mucimassa TaxID=2527972 RepID=A0A518ATM1_9BACT|nr:5-(carboxyamino)imidazole ribonucleotide synthase [Aeoliella mucimassa]QDU58071.1 N5-carboxyaminoimidazole ribonucleotide synthase [Aeoliella mucimassa]
MPALPENSILGVFGGGQLGRMFAEAAHELNYRVHVYCPEADCPAAQVAELHTGADYHDFQAIAEYAQSISAATLEFENVPVASAEAAAHYIPVRPGGEALYTVQDRSREKGFLLAAGIATTPYHNVRSEEELHRAVAELGTPAVLKTTKFGYDGKGQTIVQSPEQAVEAWGYLGRHKCVLEKFIDFEREISVLVARDTEGRIETFGPIENAHANHILDVSVYPASSPAVAAEAAIAAAKSVALELDLVGLACVEFFETAAGEVMVNEIAPRPHNSGHLTIEACDVSQFRQQTLAVAGHPVAKMNAPRPAATANLLGDLWTNGEPRWEAIAEFPGVELHLYGKKSARPGRKMGHLTAVADSPAEAERLVREARIAVTR